VDPIPEGGNIFRSRPDRPWGPPSLLYNWNRVIPRGKAAGTWCSSPTPSSDQVKEEVELYLCSPSGPSWPVLRWTLLYFYPHRWYTLKRIDYSDVLGRDVMSPGGRFLTFERATARYPARAEPSSTCCENLKWFISNIYVWLCPHSAHHSALTLLTINKHSPSYHTVYFCTSGQGSLCCAAECDDLQIRSDESSWIKVTKN
jgi:hypothetical protein